jgi:hypothetical protein
MVLRLASRENYSESCQLLIGMTRAGHFFAEIVPALFGPDDRAFSTYKIAHAFGAVAASDTAITTTLLRRRAKRGGKRTSRKSSVYQTSAGSCWIKSVILIAV